MKLIRIFFVIPFFFLVTYCTKEDPVNPDADLADQGMVVNYSKLASYSKDQINYLISTTADLTGKVTASYDIDLYSLVYKTKDPFGKITNATGLLVIPTGVGKALPLVNYNHGTILRNSDVPSLLSYESQVGVMLGAQGFVTSSPDYLGLGFGTGLHPYTHAKTEASATIDMLRATRTLCAALNVSLNNQLFLTGYSQGGHAAMATHKMIEEKYSSEFTVTASAPMAGAYDVSGTMYDLLLKNQAYPSPGYLVYMLYAYNYVYNLYPNFDNVLVSPYNTTLAPYFTPPTTSDLETVEALLPGSKIPSEVFTPAFLQLLKTDNNNPFKVKLRENDLYDWKPKAPIQMCHCSGDQHVPAINSQIALDHFLANGATNVTLINPLPGGTHQTCVIPAFITTMNWFNSLKQ
jgi:hypothetical protein